jgi:alpha-beta hydrolase superfamily lysophospholipase
MCAVVTSDAVEIVRQDVTLAVRDGTLAATVVVAPSRTQASLGALIVCVPGMTYRRTYYDLIVPGHPGYSLAEFAAARGHVVVTIDNLGTGDSSRPAGSGEVDLARLGAAAADAAAEARARLVGGDLADRLPSASPATVIGIGHSMGGGVVVAAQANRSCFTAVAALGFTTQALAGIYEPAHNEAELTFSQRREWARAHIPPKLWGRTWDELEPYFEIDRSGFADLFYGDDVPAEVIAHDTVAATVAPRQASLDIITPGLGADHASQIGSPVLLAFGSVDLSPDPRSEVQSYQRSPDITLLMLDDSAHCHNLASSRAKLWERLVSWIEGIR